METRGDFPERKILVRPWMGVFTRGDHRTSEIQGSVYGTDP